MTHSTNDCNNPIAKVSIYQLNYIPDISGLMHKNNKDFFQFLFFYMARSNQFGKIKEIIWQITDN